MDIECRDGKGIVKKLIRNADCIIESFLAGYVKNLGLDYSNIRKIDEKIIMTSIIPFWQEGPYSEYNGSDLVCMAMGGFLYLCGDPDRPANGISHPHGYFFAAVDAATTIGY